MLGAGSPPPLWTVHVLVNAVNTLAESGSQPLVVVAAAAAVPQKRGLVLTFADVEAGTFLTLSDALNKTCVLEKAVEHFCKSRTVGGVVTAEHVRMLVGAAMACKSLDVATIVTAITDLRDSLAVQEVPQASREALAAAAGEALALFRRPDSSIAPAVLLAINECETFSAQFTGKGEESEETTQPIAGIPDEIAQLPGLYKERRAFETAIPRIIECFEEARKTLEPAMRTNEATALCARAILDIYVMAMADIITQRIARVALARDLVTVFSRCSSPTPGQARSSRTNSAVWCWELIKLSLIDLEEAAQAANILPPLHDQKEPWDFWEIEQLEEEMRTAGLSLQDKLPKPGETPPPMPPRTVERKPLMRTDPRALTPVGPAKCYCVLKNGLIALNKDLVSLINRGAVSLLADLFNSCDNVIHTFAAKLLATIVLPWERQSEAVASELKAELVFSESHCAEMLGLIVWHSVNGTLNNTLRRDALHLLYRMINQNNAMKELLLQPQPLSQQPYLATMVPLLQGSQPVRVLALQIICNLASQEKYRAAVYAQVGVWPLHKVLSGQPPAPTPAAGSASSATTAAAAAAREASDAEVLAAQTLGYLLAVPKCLREAQELGALARVVEMAREGRIALHCQIDPDDLEIGPEIGRGAYASVHTAKWRGHPVACKIFNELSMQFRLEDFLLEVAILSIVHHPNLMHMHGAVVRASKEAPSSFVLVTELLDSSIQKLLLQRKAGFPPATIHKYATDVAVALAYLHSLGMIHRDLKTANLLTTGSDMTVKVCDLGLSRMVTNMTMTMCAGTPKWEAPETLESGNYTTSADVYSYGIVLWEMLTAQEPYNDIRTIFELKKQVCDKKRRPDIPATCPAWLREIMKACWQPSPKKRPTFDQIVERLAQCKDQQQSQP